jgi:hypothetical protein
LPLDLFCHSASAKLASCSLAFRYHVEVKDEKILKLEMAAASRKDLLAELAGNNGAQVVKCSLYLSSDVEKRVS